MYDGGMRKQTVSRVKPVSSRARTGLLAGRTEGTQLPAGRLVSLRDVAARAGTSVPTASRVLNDLGGRYRISTKTQDRVRRAAAELRFSPNLVARSLRLGTTRTIGLVMPDIANPFFAAIARTVSNEAHGRGFAVLLADTANDTQREIELLDVLAMRQPDGLVVVPVGQDGKHLRRFESSATPIVLVDRSFPDLRLPSVVSDNRRGAAAAVDFLISRGHRRIACLRGLTGTLPDTERLQGYRDSLTRHGIRFDSRLVTGAGFGLEEGRRGTQALIDAGVRFTAIFAFSNLLGLGALETLRQASLDVPGDVSLVSFDEQPYSAALSVPMTTVRQDPAEIGRRAVAILCERIGQQRPPAPKAEVVATALEPRASVAAPRRPA
jgi:LacI family transcriptional regulator